MEWMLNKSNEWVLIDSIGETILIIKFPSDCSEDRKLDVIKLLEDFFRKKDLARKDK